MGVITQVFSTAYLYWKLVADEVKKIDDAYDNNEFVRYWTDYQKLSKQITQIQRDNTSSDTEENDTLKSIPASFHDTYSSIFKNIDMKTFENTILDIIQSKANKETIINMLKAFLESVSTITDLPTSSMVTTQDRLFSESSMDNALTSLRDDTSTREIQQLIRDHSGWETWFQHAWKDKLQHLLNKTETREPILDALDDLYRDCIWRILQEKTDDTAIFFNNNRAKLTHSKIEQLTREKGAKNIINNIFSHEHPVKNSNNKGSKMKPLTPELLCDILQEIEIKNTDEISLSDISRWYQSQRPSSSPRLLRCEEILNLIPKIPSLSNSSPYDLQTLLKTIDPTHHYLLTTYIINGNININALENLTKTDNEAFLSSLRLSVNAITQDDSKSHNLESLFLALSKARNPKTFKKLLTLLIPDESQHKDTFYQKLNRFWEKRYNKQLDKNGRRTYSPNSYNTKMGVYSFDKKTNKQTIYQRHNTLFKRAEKNKKTKTSASNVTLGRV